MSAVPFLWHLAGHRSSASRVFKGPGGWKHPFRKPEVNTTSSEVEGLLSRHEVSRPGEGGWLTSVLLWILCRSPKVRSFSREPDPNDPTVERVRIPLSLGPARELLPLALPRHPPTLSTRLFYSILHRVGSYLPPFHGSHPPYLHSHFAAILESPSTSVTCSSSSQETTSTKAGTLAWSMTWSSTQRCAPPPLLPIFLFLH